MVRRAATSLTAGQHDFMPCFQLMQLRPAVGCPSRRSAAAGQRVLVLALAVLSIGSGCGYVVGPMHREQVRSIAVPVFSCEDDRRGLGLRLTEAVHKEIERRLPYRIVPSPQADSRLSGRVLAVYKDVLGETRNDDPRTLQMQLAVEVTWTDTRTQQILAKRVVADDSPAVTLMTDTRFSPEMGQSMATASQEMIDRMARRIVDLLETPW